MLISPSTLRSVFRIPPVSVLHVGAHMAEEEEDYKLNGFGPITWVECNPSLVETLRKKIKPPDNFIESCIGDENGREVVFYIAGASSSIFERIGHDRKFPTTVPKISIRMIMSRLDNLLDEQNTPKLLNLDIEGSELDAIKGMGNLIKQVQFIYLEVTRAGWGNHPDYKQINKELKLLGFRKVGIHWHWQNGFGDAVYFRDKPSVLNGLRIRMYFLHINYRRFKDAAKRTFLNKR